MRTYDKIFVNGGWEPSDGTGTLDVINSTTEEVMATIPNGTASDVDRAVASARTAFESWSQTTPAERAACLNKIAEGLMGRMDEIASVVSEEVGMVKQMSTLIQAGLPLASFQNQAKVVESYQFEEEIENSLVVKEPAGVVGAITPWNYPLHQIAAKVAPALAAGCTIVVKPSEVAPCNAFILAEIIEAAGVPAGVFNLVTGEGPSVGEAIAAHPDIDLVSFTGSTRAGRQVAEVAAGTVKRVALELGGKSPNVILDDADFEKAVTAGVNMCFINSGQTCTALTRMLVPQDKLAEVESLVTKVAEGFTTGDPFQEGSKLGPLVSAPQQERVRNYINKGIEEGAKLLTGGPETPDGLDKGYFVQPTVFSNVSNDMTIAREEIFGPVLSIIPYKDEDEAVELANDTDYGLAGAVWSGDQERAKAVARKIRTGQVDVNGGGFNPMAPFGGYKQSGYGREHGPYGLEEYLEVKSMQL